MKPKIPIPCPVAAVTAIASLTLSLAAHGDLASIVTVTGSNGGQGFGFPVGNLPNITDGSGMNIPDLDDAATWTATSNGWQDEWQSSSLLSGGINGKIGWIALDLGSVQSRLSELYLWNQRENDARFTDQYNLYYASSPTVGLPAQPGENAMAADVGFGAGDYDFSSAGWTQIGGTLSMSTRNDPGESAIANDVIALGGISARYIAIEILSNTGDGNRVGLAEAAIAVAPAEPVFGAIVPAGDVELSWTNPPANTGTDVWVDVWFGTNSGALTQVATKQLNLAAFTVSAPTADTYYWRLDHYLNGSATGTPVTGDEWDFRVIDSDGDGLPDEFETAHSGTTTGLNPGDDLEHGGAGDGLTNLQEYEYDTDPNNPDSDGDGLEDGPEVAGAGSRPPTDPADDDTDGDTINDRIESNTGTWVSALTDTGTDPTDPDSDDDNLRDDYETNTDNYVNETDTGTDPNSANSDGDNAGDWYEVFASNTDPTDNTDQPVTPYPLPDPDDSPGATDKPVKVYIMSGQSNMVGFGQLNGNGPGTLKTLTGTDGQFPNLVKDSGAWTERKDVYYRGVISDEGDGKLAPAVAGDKFGPELGFGYVMGYHHDEPVLLIKSSIGNRSLGWDCLPPGSASFVDDGTNYAGYGQWGNWPVGDHPPEAGVWYAGKQFDDYFLHETDMGLGGWTSGIDYLADGDIGTQIRHNGAEYQCTTSHTSSAATEPGVGAGWASVWKRYSVFNAADVLDNFATEYPDWATQGFEIAGFVWWQGHKDGGEQGTGTAGIYATRYEENLVNLIGGLRNYYETRYPGKTVPNAPFVVASVGFGGGGWEPGSSADVIHSAQMAVGDPAEHPALAGTVASVDTTGFWRDFGPSSQGYHYNWNAETYMLVGDALGRAMISLDDDVSPPVPDPMSFEIAPTAVDTSTVGMVATTAADASGPVEYWFENTTNGDNSGWTTSTTWSNTGLTNGVSYGFQVKARDANLLETGWSPVSSAAPGSDITAPTPNPMSFATPPTATGQTSITMSAATASDINGVQYMFDCLTAGGHDSGWQDSPSYTDTGLTPGTAYSYQVRARDKSAGQNPTGYSGTESATTDAPNTPPTLASSDIVDDQGGGPVLENTPVTYTLTFSEDINDSTVTATDFGNAGTAPISIGAISETSPGVFSVQVTPTSDGTLRFQVSAGAVITDVGGTPLDTAFAIVDDTTITVEVDTNVPASVPISSVTTHDNRDNYGGNHLDTINGSGMNGVEYPNDQVSWPPASDPSTWTTSSGSYRDDWQGQSQLSGATNGKIGWAAFDFGSAVAGLDSLYLWNVRETSSRGTATFNIWYHASTPTGAPPTGTNGVDYDFAGNGWTKLNTGVLSLAIAGSAPASAEGVYNLGGITAQHLGIEILTAHGATDRTGLAEVAVTASSTGGGNDFSDWIAMFPGVGTETDFIDDPDRDGNDNGLENFFGTDPSQFTAGLTAGELTTGGSDTFTFTHPQNASPADDVSAPVYSWSLTLQGAFNLSGETESGTTVTFDPPQLNAPSQGITTVTARITGMVPTKLFVDVGVTQN